MIRSWGCLRICFVRCGLRRIRHLLTLPLAALRGASTCVTTEDKTHARSRLAMDAFRGCGRARSRLLELAGEKAEELQRQLREEGIEL
ncbi:hypothetical protein PSAB6_270039 [Paraburkholderia sabiae]|nr:hypothetical protein PSAB6_270039 [Paraburkholderia sabiae]